MGMSRRGLASYPKPLPVVHFSFAHQAKLPGNHSIKWDSLLQNVDPAPLFAKKVINSKNGHP